MRHEVGGGQNDVHHPSGWGGGLHELGGEQGDVHHPPGWGGRLQKLGSGLLSR